MLELPNQDASKNAQDSPLTPQLLFEMHGAPCAATDPWPRSGVQSQMLALIWFLHTV